jgi:antitoxin HigA-1
MHGLLAGSAALGYLPCEHNMVLIMSKSSTTTNEIPNPTPGEVPMLDFIEPMGLTQNGLARAIGVPPRRINEIVLGNSAVTADTDLRMARYFGSSDRFAATRTAFSTHPRQARWSRCRNSVAL